MSRAKHILAALLAAVPISMASPSMEAYAFQPWSNVNGYWISADGKTPIKGALTKGVTITKYQNKSGEIDWKKLAKSDLSFAMIRLGYMDEPDPYFEDNMKNADSVGLKTGICFYGKALTAEEARKEAGYVLDIVKDYRITYPISYDVTSRAVSDDQTKKEVMEQIQAFCETIEEAGYKAVIYGDYDWLNNYVDIKELSFDVWYDRAGILNNYPNRTMWRCSDTWSIDGISGNVCLEFCFEDYRKSFPGTGWRTINGVKYYFNNYSMVKSKTLRIDGNVYYFDERGRSGADRR